MTASSLIVKEWARKDVQDIVEYIALDSPRSAERFRVEFKQAIDRIRSFPHIGHRANLDDPDLRLVRVSSRFHRYLIAYRLYDQSHVKILRVLHSSMDIAAHLTGL